MNRIAILLVLAMSAGAAFSQSQPGQIDAGGDVPPWLTDPPNPLDLTVTGAADNTLEAIVGPEGGRFELTDAAGNRFALSFPEGALLTDTEIRMTPIAESRGLPEGAGPISGLLLEPDGLQLARDAVLEIVPATPIAPGDRLHWGFYAGGEDAFLHIPDLKAEGIAIPLAHFSGAGVSVADRINLQLDRWRQKALEDRVSTHIGIALRVAAGGRTSFAGISEDVLDGAERALEHGRRRLALDSAATCADVKTAIQSLIGLERQGQIFGASGSTDAAFAARLNERLWSLCFPEELRRCLGTGNLQFIVDFAIAFARQKHFVGLEDAADPQRAARDAELRQALERCGRYKLEIRASGRWSDPSGVTGNLAFNVDVPIRLEFSAPPSMDFRIYGEAPATDVSVSFKDTACWKLDGHRPGAPAMVRVRSMEFRRDGGLGPLRLSLDLSAPEILGSISCQGRSLEHPFSPMVWAVAHKPERTGDNFKLTRFKAGSHPKLFTLDWTGQNVEDGLNASDASTLTFVHIGQ